MNKLTFAKLRQKNLQRVGEIHNCGQWQYPEWVMAVCGELGEMANILKKVKRGSKKWNKTTKLAVQREIADTLIYLDLLAQSLDIELDIAVIEKFNLVSKKYSSKIII
jgi:NTP pyrophosphatase (non-canonical NTP hydrolase)